MSDTNNNDYVKDAMELTPRGCLIWGIGLFGLALISSSLGFLFQGGDYAETYFEGDGGDGSYRGYVIFTFIIFIVSVIVYFYRKGKEE